MTAKKKQIREYYEYLQRALPDFRDPRGKKHDLHFVLTSVLLSVLSGKVMVREIHRYLKRHHQILCRLWKLDQKTQFRIVNYAASYQGVDSMTLQHVNSVYFGFTTAVVPQDHWISFDGKEIRGTIDGVSGEKRGLNIVHPFIQQDKISLKGLFYHGLKESEITCVRQLLEDSVLAQGAVVFDALHTQYETLTIIE